MSNEIIFWTQITSLVVFIFVIFGLYRLLVDQKDATIQMLKETVSTLKDQLAEVRSSTPDALAQALSARVKLLEGELERLPHGMNANQELIHKKEEELKSIRQNAEELKKQTLLAQEVLKDFRCPICDSPLESKSRFSETVCGAYGHEKDVYHTRFTYECGYAIQDGKPLIPCSVEKTFDV